MADKIQMDNNKTVPLDVDLEQMLISAERYACGRKTYIVSTTSHYIQSLFPKLSGWCLSIIRNDLDERFTWCERTGETLGMMTDHLEWKMFRKALEEELDRREKVEDA